MSFTLSSLLKKGVKKSRDEGSAVGRVYEDEEQELEGLDLRVYKKKWSKRGLGTKGGSRARERGRGRGRVRDMSEAACYLVLAVRRRQVSP